MNRATRVVFANIDVDSMSDKRKLKEYIKNMEEGNNQDIYMCPEKKNLVLLKKQFIKRISKKRNESEVNFIAHVLMDSFETTNNYFYVDYGDDKFKNNNYYECYSFTENDLTSLVQEKAIHESTKDKLIKYKKELICDCEKNIVCFGHKWHLSASL